jgi:hypothetical protein
MLEQILNIRNWPAWALLVVILSPIWIHSVNFFISGKRHIRKNALIICNHSLLCTKIIYMLYALIASLFFIQLNTSIRKCQSCEILSFILFFTFLLCIAYAIRIHNKPAILISKNKIILFNKRKIILEKREIKFIGEEFSMQGIFPSKNLIFIVSENGDTTNSQRIKFKFTRVTWYFSRLMKDLRSYGWEV